MTAESVLSGSGSNFMLLYMPCFLRTYVLLPVVFQERLAFACLFTYLAHLN